MKKNTVTFILGGFIFILVTLILCSTLLFLRYRPFLKDISAPPDDADMQLELEPVPDKDNAWYYINEACKSIQLTDEQQDNLDALLESNVAAIEPVLMANKACFDFIDQAKAAPKAQAPGLISLLNDSDQETPSQELHRFNELQTLISLKAHYLSRADNHNAALNELQSFLILINRLNNNPNTTLSYLISRALTAGLANDFADTILSEPCTRKEIQSFYAQFDQLLEHGKNTATVFKGEYYFLNHELEKGKVAYRNQSYTDTKDSPIETETIPESTSIIGQYLFQPNRTLKQIYDYYAFHIDAAGQPYCTVYNAIDDIERELADLYENKWLTLISPNVVGRIYQALMSGGKSIIESTCESNAQIAATQTMIGLKCYMFDHGTLPENLAALVPEYLPELPMDWYGGGAIKYDPSTREVYCDVSFMTYDGDDQWKQPNARWKIPF